MGALDMPGKDSIGTKIGGCLWSVVCIFVFMFLNWVTVCWAAWMAQWIVHHQDLENQMEWGGITVGAIILLVYQGVTVAWIVYATRKMERKPEPLKPKEED